MHTGKVPNDTVVGSFPSQTALIQWTLFHSQQGRIDVVNRHHSLLLELLEVVACRGGVRSMELIFGEIGGRDHVQLGGVRLLCRSTSGQAMAQCQGEG